MIRDEVPDLLDRTQILTAAPFISNTKMFEVKIDSYCEEIDTVTKQLQKFLHVIKKRNEYECSNKYTRQVVSYKKSVLHEL